MKFNFINEMADLCEAVGADVQDVARGIPLDNRIGAKFLHPGPGYAGSCFSIFTVALLRAAEEAVVEQRIISTVVSVNEDRKAAMVDRSSVRWTEAGTASTLGYSGWRLSRHARCPVYPADKGGWPSAGLEGVAFDPVGGKRLSRWEEVAYGADAIVLVTEWDEFRGLSLRESASRMRRKALLDIRNIYDQGEAERAGLRLLGIGRGARDKP